MTKERRNGFEQDASEKRLLEGLQLGQEDSYELLVRTYGGKMLSVARRLVGSVEDARDCVQDAFLQAFKNIHGFQGRSTLWTWLHRIVVNVALQKLRSRRRRPEQSVDELMPRFDAFECRVESPGALQPLEKLLQRREVREEVRRCLQLLPEGYRNVLLLRDIEGFDTEETAGLLGMTPGAVKTRLHRARCALKKLLEPTMKAEPP